MSIRRAEQNLKDENLSRSTHNPGHNKPMSDLEAFAAEEGMTKDEMREIIAASAVKRREQKADAARVAIEAAEAKRKERVDTVAIFQKTIDELPVLRAVKPDQVFQNFISGTPLTLQESNFIQEVVVATSLRRDREVTGIRDAEKKLLDENAAKAIERQNAIEAENAALRAEVASYKGSVPPTSAPTAEIVGASGKRSADVAFDNNPAPYEATFYHDLPRNGRKKARCIPAKDFPKDDNGKPLVFIGASLLAPKKGRQTLLTPECQAVYAKVVGKFDPRVFRSPLHSPAYHPANTEGLAMTIGHPLAIPELTDMIRANLSPMSHLPIDMASKHTLAVNERIRNTGSFGGWGGEMPMYGQR